MNVPRPHPGERRYDVRLLPPMLLAAIEENAEAYIATHNALTYAATLPAQLEQLLNDVGTGARAVPDIVPKLQSMRQQADLREVFRGTEDARVFAEADLRTIREALELVDPNLFHDFVLVAIEKSLRRPTEPSPVACCLARLPVSDFVSFAQDLLSRIHARYERNNFHPPLLFHENVAATFRACAIEHGYDSTFVFEAIIVPVANRCRWPENTWISGVVRGLLLPELQLPDAEKDRFVRAAWTDLRMIKSQSFAYTVLSNLGDATASRMEQHALDRSLSDAHRCNALWMCVRFPRDLNPQKLAVLTKESGGVFLNPKLYLISDERYLRFDPQPAIDAVSEVFASADAGLIRSRMRIFARRPDPYRNTPPERAEVIREVLRRSPFAPATLEALSDRENSRDWPVAADIYCLVGSTTVIEWACEVGESVLNANAADLFEIATSRPSIQRDPVDRGLKDLLASDSAVSKALRLSMIAADNSSE